MTGLLTAAPPARGPDHPAGRGAASAAPMGRPLWTTGTGGLNNPPPALHLSIADGTTAGGDAHRAQRPLASPLHLTIQ
eukprot:390906-Pyramimonas_sp.AAC.1